MCVFNLRATALLAINQHPVRVLVALASLGPVWAVTLMSITISTHLTKVSGTLQAVGLFWLLLFL